MTRFAFPKLRTAYQTRERSRRELQGFAATILRAAKRSIFALHRDDRKTAQNELGDANEALKNGRRLISRDASLASEGMWRAGLEELSEAQFFMAYIEAGRVDRAELPTDESDIVIGGLTDAVGEIARHAVLAATARDRAAVDRAYETAQDIIARLLEMDLTGNARTKFDQAKQALRKIEEIRYDLSLRS